MSFPRAKRFNYKESDITVSPADYYITSPLDKTLTISKSPRFTTTSHRTPFSDCKQENSRCSKYQKSLTRTDNISTFSRNSFRNAPNACSTPQKKNNSTDIDKIQEEAVSLNRSDIKNVSFRRKPTKSVPENKFKTTDLNQKHQNHPNELHFSANEEFFDDDYHSYTSSEEIDSLSRLKYHVPERQDNSSTETYFEKNVLEQMEKININIQSFKNNIKELREEICSNKKHNKKLSRRNSINICPSELSLPTDKSDDIKYTIRKAIDKLRKEFESSQNKILSQAIQKIGDVARDIYSASEVSKNQIKKLCGNITSDLTLDIVELIHKDDTLEFEISKDYGEELQKVESMLSPESECFRYENICQILSDHLQISHRELDDLKRDKTNIMDKYESAQEAIQTQTSIINKLHEELTELKNSY